MIELRRAGGSDAAILRAVRLRALADAPDAFASALADEEQLDRAHWEAMADALTQDEERVVVLAQDGPSCVGMAGGRWHDRPAGTAQLWGMWVDPAARRTGLGEQLVDAIAGWAAAAGAQLLRLGVVEGIPAERFYARLGFAPTGKRRPLTRDPALTAVFLDRGL